MRKMEKNKKKNKKKEFKVAMRNLADLYNNYPENRTFIFPELEDEGIQAS